LHNNVLIVNSSTLSRRNTVFERNSLTTQTTNFYKLFALSASSQNRN